MDDALDKLYQAHHASGGRYDLSLLKKERGDFLRNEIGTGKRVLDIGCRDGTLTSTYCQGNAVFGIDIDSTALEHARSALGIETLQFDLTGAWPLKNCTFDFVVAGEVLEHLYFPEEAIGKIAKVLKTDGALLGSVPNAFNLKNRFRLFLAQKRYTPLNDPTHINHFSRRELLRLLSRNFKQVDILPLGRFALFDRVWPGMFSFDLLFAAQYTTSLFYTSDPAAEL